jgi:glucose/mannose transport system permease protein
MTIPATIISTLLGAMNGYILSKWRFRGSEVLFTCMLFGVFMPGQLALMPWAFILGNLGLSNTTAGLVLVHVVQGISFTTLFCRNFFVGIPDDLIKAARIDGAGFWRIFFKIVLPISPPILIVTVIWQFTGIWNEFLYGVVFTSGAAQPITAALVALSASEVNVRHFDVMSAGVLIAALPPLLIYFFGGKYFVRGLTQGAIK